jgi:hypothetical protein
MMKINKLVLAGALAALSIPAMAQEMRCGEKLISGDQMQPLLEEQVLSICGEPSQRDGYNWYYDEQGKILVFNGNGELETIQDMNAE